ncbi:MAG: SusC/RagA family TonB-linked outer membrane protein [Bacteroidia bacterium]|nr:SusC/RagA family TonB-linked outer membrane protein [Bacteroidia bacterium]MBT8309701.1 SusC/RagA family TonB-linked outer membrane protein [Bacteroidia bacterium]NND12140.1 SusC/RagA family TonB-linked outer membrane protein [Flavobacteriaceae bacterium]NNK28943.1 SusC/RagA family TonB-linked outer membrane protein [Flavobacteriaceae bacterium]NNL61465.1 SusC/RagA family TonB-linked outer membrane protein [Flavobacteriaceae bacterium]
MKIKLLKSMVLLGAMLSFGFIQAQSVSGTVIDNNGIPLPGANVIVQGTSNGAQTDFDGNYTLNNVASDAVLVVSYVGYDTQEIPVNGQSTVNVTLQEGNALDEVIVIGYGATTVKDATGAVSSVSAEDFNAGIIATPEQLIQGKTAGVQITQTSGEPGAGIDIRIRGTNSVRSNNNPLFVVDGIPLAGGSTSAGLEVAGVGSNPAKNPLSFLNPNDIASISVLKDASATAIYGARGSNGVVIITTKTGRSNRGEFQYSSNLSVSNPAKTFDLLDRNSYLSESTRLGFNANARDFGSDTSWQGFIYRGSASTNQNLSYSKNYGQGNYRATFGYGKQVGIVESADLERITGRLNVVHRLLDDKLKLDFQGTISRVNDDTAPLAGTAGFRGDLIGASYAANPTWPVDPDFGRNGETGGLINPANLLAYTQNETKTNRYLLSLSGEYSITDDLKAKLSGGYDYTSSDNRAVSSADNLIDAVFGNGRGNYNDFEFENTIMEATLNYNTDLGNDSRLDVLAGYSYQKFDRNGVQAQGWGFGSRDLNRMGTDLVDAVNRVTGQITGPYQQFGFGPNVIGAPAGTNTFINRLTTGLPTDYIAAQTGGAVKAAVVNTFDNFDEIQSYFARVNYTLNNKYLFTATMRADGSTTFGEGNKYGYFPSGAIAWKLSEEDFIGDNVSTLKLRLNAGLTGNQEGVGYGNAIRRTRFNGTGIANNGDISVPGTGVVAFENRDLKWESTLQYGGGIDFGFNNDRLNGSVDVYRKETRDLLFNINSAQPAIQPFRFVNLPDSKIINEGIEFALGYDFIQSEDLTWNMTANVALNDNVVESLTGEYIAGAINGQGLTNAFSQNLKEGYPLFSWYIREFEGFDTNGNAIIGNGGDPVFVGKSALPEITGGLSTSVNYKNWNLNAYFNGAFGHYLYNATRNAFFTAGSFASARNVLAETLTSGESTNASADPSTRFLEKGDFVRLQNLSLSYNLPMEGDGLFKSVLLSVTGQNVFVITDYSGLDPEVSSRTDGGLPTLGIDYGAFPNPRTFTFGINAKF